MVILPLFCFSIGLRNSAKMKVSVRWEERSAYEEQVCQACGGTVRRRL